MTGRVLLAALLLCGASMGRAEEEVADSTSDLEAVQLLDEVPNYAEILRDQWSSGVPQFRPDRAGEYYGLLIDTGPMRELTLEQAIALALQNNTGLRVERLNPVLATAGVRLARSVFDPALFGTADKSRRNEPASTESIFTTGTETDSLFSQRVQWDLGLRKQLLTGGQLSLDWTNSRNSSNPTVVNVVNPDYLTTLGFTLNQPLLRNFGWRYALLLVDVAQNTEEQSYYQYAAEVANLVTRVETLYWVYVLAIENVQVEEQGLELAKELLRQNEGRFNVGALPRTAVLESQAEVARREANLVRARNLRRVARDELRAIMNTRQPDDDALLMIEPADRPAAVPYEIDLEASLRRGWEMRPELIAARLDVGGKRLLQKVAENALLPKVDFVGLIGLNALGGIESPSEEANPINSKPNDLILGGYPRALELLTDGRWYQYAFGARIEVPISNAAAKAGYAQANISTERARLSLRQLEETITLEIKTAVDNLRSLLKSIEATRVARELAEENVRNQQARYDVGLATTKDLVDFQERLTRARQGEIVALTRYNTDLASLRRADGTLLDYRNIELRRPEPEEAPWWARF